MEDPPVMEMPVQSMVTMPTPNETVAVKKTNNKHVYVKGISWGGAGSGINRVDVSLDDGKSFTRANLIEKPIQQPRKSQWSWQFFEHEIPIPEYMRKELQKG